MELSNCHKTKRTRIENGLSRLGSAISSGILNSLKTVTALVSAFFTSKVAILKPLTSLNKVFIENFIAFPLNAASSTVTGIKATLRAPLFSLGIDKDCTDHKKMHESMEKNEKKTEAVSRKFKNHEKQAQSEVADQEKQVIDMQVGIEVADDFNGIVV